MNYKANYKKGIFLFSNNGFSAFRISFFLFTVFLLSCLLFSCGKDSTNGTDTITISGTVTLENQSDNSGVTVRLYRPVQLDTALVRINQQYPNIGVQVSQETEFDHREQNAVYSTTTSADGNWSIGNVTPGTYNVVASADSFGWGVVLNRGNNTNIELKKSQYLAGNYTSQNFNYNNSFLNITGLTSFDQNAQINFQGTNYIRFTKDNLSLIIKGSVTFGTGAKLIIVTDNNSNCQVNFDNINSLNLKNMIVRDVKVFINNCGFSVSNSVFKNSSGQALRLNLSNGSVDNCILKLSDIGMLVDQAVNSSFENNIYYMNNFGCEVNFVDNLNIKNNLFNQSNSTDVKLVASTVLIKHNQFSRSTNNINIIDESDIEIKSNNFVNSGRNIRTTFVSHQNRIIDIIAHFNNFLNTSAYTIYLETGADTTDARNNYWETTIDTEILAKIRDGHITTGLPLVDYQPFLATKIDTIGIK